MSTYTAEPAVTEVEDDRDDHAEAELHDIFELFAVHAFVGCDDGLIPAARTGLVDVLLAWRDGSGS
jgi:hypothetical protein